MDFNSVGIIGRLTDNPKFAMSQNGKPWVQFTIANKGLKDDDVNFIDCKAFNGPANLINQYCKKGQRVALKGTLRQEKWTDQTGMKHSKMVIMVDEVQFLEKAKEAPVDHHAPENNPYYSPAASTAEPMDSVPPEFSAAAPSFSMPTPQF